MAARSADLTPQQMWVEKLAYCENRNHVSRVLDSNDKYSYGDLQFQMDTWLRYSDTFHTRRENIQDPELQRIVALYILNSGGWRNWKNCATKFVIPSLGEYPIPKDTS